MSSLTSPLLSSLPLSVDFRGKMGKATDMLPASSCPGSSKDEWHYSTAGLPWYMEYHGEPCVPKQSIWTMRPFQQALDIALRLGHRNCPWVIDCGCMVTRGGFKALWRILRGLTIYIFVYVYKTQISRAASVAFDDDSTKSFDLLFEYAWDVNESFGHIGDTLVLALYPEKDNKFWHKSWAAIPTDFPLTIYLLDHGADPNVRRVGNIYTPLKQLHPF